MCKSNNYIGITIGPIFETINLSSSPLQLWLGSFTFSTIAKLICQKLVNAGLDCNNFISPYYSEDDETLNKNDGIGLFHDRIIFKNQKAETDDFPNTEFSIDDIQKIKDDVFKEIAAMLNMANDVEFLKEYFMIQAVEFEANNPILDSSVILDNLELSMQFVKTQKKNPFLLNNETIKITPIFKNVKNNSQLTNGDNIKSLPEIAEVVKDGYKKRKYYAIVRADGDNIGEIISGLSDNDFNVFSKCCLTYCSEAAKLVKKYNGVTIYAGGDDLLAILPCESPSGNIAPCESASDSTAPCESPSDSTAPCESASDSTAPCESPSDSTAPCGSKSTSGKTIFDFSKELMDTFNKTVCQKYPKANASLSIGITICYNAFPLYEALQDSAKMLFDVAKENGKNCVVVHLQKHSGQSEGILIPKDMLDTFINFQNEVLRQDKDLLLSSLHKIHLFSDFFLTAGDCQTMIDNIFENTFDGPQHNGNFISKVLPQFYKDCEKIYSVDVLTLDDAKKDPELKSRIEEYKVDRSRVHSICYILRILKFFIEKGE